MGASRCEIHGHVEVHAKSESDARIEHAGRLIDAISEDFLDIMLIVSIDFP
jgi:hypothetical protein